MIPNRLCLAVAGLLLIAACSKDEATSTDTGSLADTAGSGSADTGAADTEGSATDTNGSADISEPATCPDGLPRRAWQTGEAGTLRNTLAGDLSLREVPGRQFQLSQLFDGCSSFIFLPDNLVRSSLDNTLLWYADLANLIANSPENLHYVFVSVSGSDNGARGNTTRMTSVVETVLATYPTELNNAWYDRIHVLSARRGTTGTWLDTVMASDGIGSNGFAIDRFQKLRGMGSIADVERFSAALNNAGGWPYEDNMAYAANEAKRFNYEAALQARLDAEDALVVPFYNGEVLAQFDDKEVELPSADVLATYDTMEVDVTALCPDQNGLEFGNCGAWDYLAYLWIYDANDQRVELARFITSYHREGRAIVDVTPAMAHLLAGGLRKFRWEFAPEWNTQPTSTYLSLRFSRRGKGYRPARVTPLFTGGAFGPDYNNGREPVQVAVGADAVHTELFAIISGHGADFEQCAEFCDHHHLFAVNGRIFEQGYPMVGDVLGCAKQIDKGVVPNQWGTWWFGRGGWCPGQQVEPFRVDVTDIAAPGATATFRYDAYLGADVPTAGAGNINLTSYLVEYVAMGSGE